VNSNEKNSLDFCLDFVQEFGLCTTVYRLYSTVENAIELEMATFLRTFSDDSIFVTAFSPALSLLSLLIKVLSY
jgi:hypothetical protein